MTFGASEEMIRENEGMELVSISMFPRNGQFETLEQMRGFELLRLAFFTLKLRKLDQLQEQDRDEAEHEFRRNLLRHVIFQQIVTLTGLDAREQAYQLIDVCRK